MTRVGLHRIIRAAAAMLGEGTVVITPFIEVSDQIH